MSRGSVATISNTLDKVKHLSDMTALAAMLEMADTIDPSKLSKEQRMAMDPEDLARKYDTRNNLVMLALGKAIECGFEAGIGVDHSNPGWPVIYIELPEGQVSWHVSQHEKSYDGHDQETKTERLKKFCQHYV